MRDGDIYFWKWADEGRQNGAAFGDYHCYSRIAIASGGTLYDTYWSDQSKSLKMDEIIVTLQGNQNDMTEIHEWDVHYYRPEDVVSLQHPNNSRGKIYLKPGATKNAAIMHEYATYQMVRAQQKAASEYRTADRFRDILAQIERGEIDDVFF